MEEVGKRIVPSWSALKAPRSLKGRICYHGNCTFDENVGLMISSPRVFRAEIVTVIEPDTMLEPSSFRNVVRAMRQGMVDDEIVQLIRGLMFTLASSEYWDERQAPSMFGTWRYLASLPHGTDINDVLESKFDMDVETQFYYLEVMNNILGGCLGMRAYELHICVRAYILRIIKDNSCPCSCCRRSYISVVKSNILQEDNLIVVDYGGHFVVDFQQLEIVDENSLNRGDRIPLIVAQSEGGGKAKFLSTIVQDRGILHTFMTLEMEAITIV